MEASAWKERLRQAAEDCRRKARLEMSSLRKHRREGNGGQTEHSGEM